MERLKTRQRLEAINISSQPTPLTFNEVRNQPPDDEIFNSHLATKIRVNSLINQSIPDMAYAPKKLTSSITAQQLEEFQQKENTPITIDGRTYRVHPASIPEPDLEYEPTEEEALKTFDMDYLEDPNRASAIARVITDTLEELKQAEEIRVGLNDARKQIDTEFDKLWADLQRQYYDSDDRQKIDIDRAMVQLERRYNEAQRRIYEQEQDTNRYIEERKTIIQDARQAQSETVTDIAEVRANIQAIKERNKAKVKAYEDSLKSVNRSFNMEQQPGETQENYLARIREQTQAVDDEQGALDRLNLKEARDFKNNLKNIIRDPTLIEYAYNKIFDSGKGDKNILEINKVFQLLKTRYEKLYGTFQLKEDDLVKFLMQGIENPEETLRRDQEEEDLLMAVQVEGGAGAEEPSVLAGARAGANDLQGKYEALNKGRRYTKVELAKGIRDLVDLREFKAVRDFKEDPVEVQVRGNIAKLIVGARGGLSYSHEGITKGLEQADKDMLIAFYVDILQSLKRLLPEKYAEINARINRVTQDEYGEGLGIPQEELPKSFKLGKIEIDLNKLFYKNILSIKQKGFKITGAKNMPVSDEFVKIIMDLCKDKKYPISKDLNKLQMHESQVFDALLHLAGLHKRIEHTANKSIEQLKNRLTLIEGEISAGNTNPMLKQEIRDIVFKLHHLGEITGNSANEYLKQMK